MSHDIDLQSAHVWRVALDRDSNQRSQTDALLSEDEQSRAGRFRFERDRDRWTACRGALRRILGSYLGLTPAMVRFCRGPYGKPFLGGLLDGERLEFNVSHSDAYALIAVTRDGPIGVDLEHLRREIACDLSGVFAPDEQALLDAAAPDQKAPAFFRLWTRKEALLKAAGTGFSGTLNGSTLCESETRIVDLTPADGYLGAVAVPSGVTRIVQYDDD